MRYPSSSQAPLCHVDGAGRRAQTWLASAQPVCRQVSCDGFMSQLVSPCPWTLDPYSRSWPEACPSESLFRTVDLYVQIGSGQGTHPTAGAPAQGRRGRPACSILWLWVGGKACRLPPLIGRGRAERSGMAGVEKVTDSRPCSAAPGAYDATRESAHIVPTPSRCVLALRRLLHTYYILLIVVASSSRLSAAAPEVRQARGAHKTATVGTGPVLLV